jgi:ABC-type antimicrobial peptide transport system permease subunit
MAMIFSNLWRRKTRTLLTIVGIAVGVGAVIFFSAFGEGYATGFERTFGAFEADLTIAQKDSMMLFLSSVDESIGAELKQMPGVEKVTGTVGGFLTLPDVPYFIVMGQEPRSFVLGHYKLIEGRALASRREIMLGRITAKNYRKTVGSQFSIKGLSFDVVGIYETGVSFEDGGAVIPLSDAQGLFDKQKHVSYYNVKVSDARQIDSIKSKIEARWPELAATRSGEPTSQTEALNLTRSFGWFLGIFAVLVGGVGMMNAMLMSVLERTREIGVLRAVGWRRRRIIGMILGESLLLALIGGILGIGVGIGLVRLAQTVPAVENMLSGVIMPTMYAQGIIVALVLGAVGGFYPAWRAARLAPIEAMRAEGGASVSTGRVTRFLAQRFGGGSLRNLWRRPTRTFVTAFGLGIGVGFVVMLLVITEGFTVLFTQLGGVGEYDLMAEQLNVADASLSIIEERTADEIARQPEVKGIAKIILGVSTAPGLPYFMIFGIDPEENYIQHYRIREGRTVGRTNEIMVGRFAANAIKKGIGETVRVAGRDFAIVGIYENGSPFEDASGVITLSDAQRVFRKQGQVSFLGIAVHDSARAGETAVELERRFPELAIARVSEFTDRMNDMKATYAVVNALTALTMVVGGIVMMNVMLMSVFERTQEIGILRALGWRRRRVLRMVLFESLALSVLATVAGVVLGIAMAYLVTLEPTVGMMLTPGFNVEMFVQVAVLALVLGTIGGLYPAWRAANLRPIEALRYE